MVVTSSRSSINIRHLEKATVSTGKEGLLSEGNAAYNWSRCAFCLLLFWPSLKLFNYKSEVKYKLNLVVPCFLCFNDKSCFFSKNKKIKKFQSLLVDTKSYF